MGGVQTILTTVMIALSEDPARRFTWSEFKFFEMWWKEQTAVKKELVRGLLENRQLEFVNGGWSSHDEACPTF